MPEPVVVAEVVRSGFIEGRHRGSVVALEPDGSIGWSVGDVTGPMLPRSSNKPIQALGMVRLGLELPSELLALASASHSGEPFHLDGVRRILELGGLGESSLRNVSDYPLDEQAKTAAIRAGEDPRPLFMNCSGKHAAMLLTCVVNRWEPASYLSPEHPLQRGIAATFAELTGEAVTVTAVDGCGAPLLSTSLLGLARAFRTLATAGDGPEHRVAQAIRSYPRYVSGTNRDERRLIEAVPGLIAKAGAEACYAVALPDGRAFALKIEDGGGRARPVVMAEALRRAGVRTLAEVDGDGFDRAGDVPVLGGGEPVGEVRAAL